MTTVTYRPHKKALWLGAIFFAILILLLIPNGPTDHIGHDLSIITLGLISIGVFVSVLGWAQRLLITRSLDEGSLCIDERWFFLAGRHFAYPVREVFDVALEVERMVKSYSYRVILVLRDNTHVPLTDAFNDDGRHHERAAREIRALLKLPNQDAAVTVLEAPQPTAMALTAPPSGQQHSRPPAGASPTTVIYRPEKGDHWYIGISLGLLITLWVFSYPANEIRVLIPVSVCIILAPLSIYLAKKWTNRLIMTRDIGEATLRVVQHRLLARRRATVHPVRDVQDVALEINDRDFDWPVRVVMVRRDNFRIPICGGFRGGIPHHERTAREVRALLQLPNQDAPMTVFKIPRD